MYSIDKLALAVPPALMLSTFVREGLPAIMQAQRIASPSRLYRNCFTLEPLGIRALFHYGGRYTPAHKLEFLGAGEMSHSQMLAALSQIVHDPAPLRVMRVDLAADVPNVPVRWFREHAWVQYKQITDEFGKVDIRRRRGEVETLRFGGRTTNPMAIYDKLAERRAEYLKQRRRGDVALSFEDFFAYPATISALTRVEHQYSTSTVVPSPIRTFGQLRNAVHIRPFAMVRFEKAGRAPQDREPGEKMSDFLIRCSLNDKIVRDGLHNVRAWLNKNSSNNAWRYLRKCLRAKADVDIEIPDLQAIYLESVTKQLAA